MNSIIRLAAVAAGVSLVAGASAAPAAVLVATWTGIVASGHDDTGVFGAIGNLAGDAYVVRFTYDTSIGYRDNSLPAYDLVFGGSDYGYAPPVSATVTINGQTVSINGGFESDAITKPTLPKVDFFSKYTHNDANIDIQTNIEMYDQADVHQATLETPVALTTLSGAQAGNFNWFVYDYNLGLKTGQAAATLNGGTLQISAVPEPAAWALMVTGLGLMGGRLRRRRFAAFG